MGFRWHLGCRTTFDCSNLRFVQPFSKNGFAATTLTKDRSEDAPYGAVKSAAAS